MKYPLVSIFLPTYNAEKFIKECMDSVLIQNYPNMEIIISDDASTDKTAEILLEYKKNYPELINLNLNQSNIGITHNANKTLSLCKGKYIAFFAGDDVMLPNKINKQVEYLENHPECAICYHNVEVFYDDAQSKKSYLYNSKMKPRQGDLKVAIKYGIFNAGNSNMVRRDHMPEHGFDNRFKIVSDGLLYIEILEKGGEIHYIDEVLTRYRRHSNNITNILLKERCLEVLIQQSNLLLKYPQYAKFIFAQYAYVLLLLAKSNSSNAIHYLKASFKLNKRPKVLLLILIYFLTGGRLTPHSIMNNSFMQLINRLTTRLKYLITNIT